MAVKSCDLSFTGLQVYGGRVHLVYHTPSRLLPADLQSWSGVVSGCNGDNKSSRDCHIQGNGRRCQDGEQLLKQSLCGAQSREGVSRTSRDESGQFSIAALSIPAGA